MRRGVCIYSSFMGNSAYRHTTVCAEKRPLYTGREYIYGKECLLRHLWAVKSGNYVKNPIYNLTSASLNIQSGNLFIISYENNHLRYSLSCAVITDRSVKSYVYNKWQGAERSTNPAVGGAEFAPDLLMRMCLLCCTWTVNAPRTQTQAELQKWRLAVAVRCSFRVFFLLNHDST